MQRCCFAFVANIMQQTNPKPTGTVHNNIPQGETAQQIDIPRYNTLPSTKDTHCCQQDLPNHCTPLQERRP
jgi:hypothetical protein